MHAHICGVVLVVMVMVVVTIRRRKYEALSLTDPKLVKFPRPMELRLVGALEKAASPVQSQRQIGEQELNVLQKEPRFYLALLSVYGHDQVSTSSRYLAIIYLKNAIEHHWRKPSYFSPVVKQQFREELIPYLLSPITLSSRQLAKQLAVIIASIARTDYPRAWPQLLSDLNQNVIDLATQGDVEKLEVVLEVMNQVLKRLATARIGQARVQLNEFSYSQVELYFQVFTTYRLYSALKIVGTLLYAGHDREHRYSGPQAVFRGLFPILQSEENLDSKIVKRIGKIYERLVDARPYVFCGFKQEAAQVVQFFCEYLDSRPSVSGSGSGTIVQSMCLTRDLTRLYKTQGRPETSLPLNLRPRDEQDRQELSEAYALCSAIFAEPVVIRLVDSLIEHYFQMTQEDVELWKDDPSEFFVEESRQNPEYSVVLCAEMLFAHILKAWPAQVAPRAQGLIEEAVRSGEELRVEGALRALEFGAATFSQSFEIEPIVQLLISQTSSSPLIRRRLCLVVGGWVPVNDSAKLQTLAFELAKDTLTTGNWDVVVQLGALELVRICCDDIDFVPQLFSTAADPVFETIYRLLQTSTPETEIKLNALKVLSTVIEGLGPELKTEHAARILEILPALWIAETEQSNHHLIQGAVLHTAANLVTACGVVGSVDLLQQCYPVALPLVDIATDPSQPLSTFLLDDGLSVWKSLLANAPSSTSGSLAHLFGRLMTLLETKTEDLGYLLSILESYLWLDYKLALPHLNKLFGLFSLYLSDGCAMDEALLILLCTEVLVMLCDGSSSELYEAIRLTGLLEWLESCILSAGNESVPIDTLIQAGKCMNILSLVSIQSQGQGITKPEQLYPIWLTTVRGVSDPRDRKLGSMGVTALLLAQPQLFASNASFYLEVMGLIVEEIPDTAGFAQFYLSPTAEGDRLTAEECRQKEARQSEFAVRVGLQAFIRDVADHLQNNYGITEFKEMNAKMGII